MLNNYFKYLPQVDDKDIFDYLEILPINEVNSKKQELIKTNKNYIDKVLNREIEVDLLLYNIIKDWEFNYNIFFIDFLRSKENIDNLYLLLLLEEYNKKPIIENTIKTELYKHQIDCINNIINYDRNIIISTTGSGKTLMSLYYAEKLYENKLIDNIIYITERNTTIIEKELEKHLIFKARYKYKIYTYFNLNKIEHTEKSLFILDEIHNLKNTSKRTKDFNMFNAKYILGLTATLLERTKDLDNYSTMLNIQNIYKVNYDLNVPYEIKTELIKTLPHQKILKSSFFTGLDILRKELINRKEKLFYITDLISKNTDKKILINAFSLSNIDIVYNHLNLIFGCLKVTGEDKNKNTILDKFINGKTNILVSSSVLSTSYNLQTVDILIIYEQPMSYIYTKQLKGRILRMDNDKKKYIYELIYENTIEEQIYNLNKEKQKMYDKYIEEDNIDSDYTVLDLSRYEYN